MKQEATILVVDDEEQVINALERSLGLDGYNVIKTTDPFKALEVIDSEHVDVIITDHLMPQMKGVELLREVARRKPDVIRIILTGNADLDLALKAINEGEVYRFFQKPWDDETLRLDIRLALSHRKLERENRQLSDELERHRSIIEDLEKEHPGIGSVKRTESGAIIIDEDDL